MLQAAKDLENIEKLIKKSWCKPDDDYEQCKEFIRAVVIAYIEEIAKPEMAPEAIKNHGEAAGSGINRAPSAGLFSHCSISPRMDNKDYEEGTNLNRSSSHAAAALSRIPSYQHRLLSYDSELDRSQCSEVTVNDAPVNPVVSASGGTSIQSNFSKAIQSSVRTHSIYLQSSLVPEGSSVSTNASDIRLSSPSQVRRSLNRH